MPCLPHATTRADPAPEHSGSATRILHPRYQPPQPFEALSNPIYPASTVVHPDMASTRDQQWHQRDGYIYGLHGTPATFVLESKVAEVEGGRHCLLAPSGLAAITIVNLAMLRHGEHVLVPENIYAPNRLQVEWMARTTGIQLTLYDPLNLRALERLFTPNTRLVWIEAPGSVSMEVPDVDAITGVAHRCGAMAALDNTWATGLAFQGFEHGANIVVQALTKCYSGGSDAFMGAIVTRDAECHTRLAEAARRLGMGVGALDTFLVLRGMESMKVRLQAHDRGARHLANWLSQRPEVQRTLHPALSTCPGHDSWRRGFTGAGGLFSFLFKDDWTQQDAENFVESLSVFKIGFSWGGAHSVCMAYDMHSLRPQWPGAGPLVRLWVGLEDVEDLIIDVERAFTMARHRSG